MRSHRSLIPAPLNLAVTGTTQERQSFEYICLQIGQELSTALHSEPTYQFVLQACHTDDAVKAAVIAIGSMGQRLRINQVLTSNNQEPTLSKDLLRSSIAKQSNFSEHG